MICNVKDCEKPVRVKGLGLCAAHYWRHQNGVPLEKPMRKQARNRMCEFPGCDQLVKADGWCAAHYAQSKTGRPMKERRGNERSLAERLWPHVEKGDGCWIWTGALDNHGYGQLTYKSRRMRTHRVAWLLTHGEIPDGLVLDHLCRVPACCNPDHLEPVTQGENVRRGDAPRVNGARNRTKTHCPQGHPYDDVNTYVTTTGRRVCRSCQRDWSRAHYARQKSRDQ